SVGASDSTLLGFTDASLNVAGGSANVTVILLPVGALTGVVTQADAVTPVADGVKVDLFETASPSVSIATTFTDASGRRRLPLVASGAYLVEASDATGNRGRAAVVVDTTGTELTVPLAFLGRGTVIVKVTSGAGAAVVNANVDFNASSVFGGAATRTGTTDAR